MSPIHALGGCRGWWFLTTMALSAACGGEDPASADLELAGTWTTNFGSTETISNEIWTSVTPASDDLDEFRSSWAIVSYDNAAKTAIRQSSPTGFIPNAFDRTVWVDGPDGNVFVCTETFGHPTAAQAETSTHTADASDPENSGCGPFSWTQFTPRS